MKCFRVVVALLQVLFEVLLVEFSCCRGLVFRAQTKNRLRAQTKKCQQAHSQLNMTGPAQYNVRTFGFVVSILLIFYLLYMYGTSTVHMNFI